MKFTIPSSLRVFLYLLALFTIIGTVLLFKFDKGDIFLYLNSKGSKFLDEFFKLITLLGLGGLLAILAVIFLFIRYYYSILFAVSLIAAGIFSYLLKHVIFKGMPRPAGVFDLENLSHIVEGIKIHKYNSFPSGHTMTAFSLGIILTLILKNRTWGIAVFAISFAVGISRIYLIQHFFIDVYVGALIGTAYTLLIHYLIGHRLKLDYKPAFNGNLLSLIRKRK